jgi:hypothetical protein
LHPTRDRGCGGTPGYTFLEGAIIGKVILQADRLITPRGNAAAYADTRLGKSTTNEGKQGYDRLLRSILAADRIALWDAAERKSRKPTRTTSFEWREAEAALQAELAAYEQA